jgi:arylsulfatase
MSSSDRPNILWICSDSQRWDTLGCYGNEFVYTPHIDGLAAEGVLFEHAYAQNPLCTPSRGTFLTGRYPVTNRLRQNGQTVPPDLKPITRTLRDAAGYICGLSGKLHLSACDRRLTFGPEWWKVPQNQWVVPMEQRVDDGYDVFHWSHGGDDNPYNAYAQWLRERGVVQKPGESYLEELGFQVAYGRPGNLTHTAFCIDKAIEFIELHHAKQFPQPWEFSVNMVEPHPDFHPPKEFLDRYLDRLDDIPPSPFEESELEGKPEYECAAYNEGKRNSLKGVPEHDRRLIKAAYWATCDHIDDQVGKLLDVLEKTGQRENTIVIYMSDHGELLGDHGRTWKGPYLYDSCVRVPLIISWPGQIQQGVRCSGLVELTDVAPTLLDAIGLPLDPAMQGSSFWPVLTGDLPRDAFREDVYSEYYNANPDEPHKWLTMVRTATHKLIAVHGTQEGLLFDMVNDPHELHNLWDSPAHKDLKIQLLLRLCARMAYTTDPLPERIGVF